MAVPEHDMTLENVNTSYQELIVNADGEEFVFSTEARVESTPVERPTSLTPFAPSIKRAFEFNDVAIERRQDSLRSQTYPLRLLQVISGGAAVAGTVSMEVSERNILGEGLLCISALGAIVVLEKVVKSAKQSVGEEISRLRSRRVVLGSLLDEAGPRRHPSRLISTRPDPSRRTRSI